jgi:hypothetical protein
VAVFDELSTAVESQKTQAKKQMPGNQKVINMAKETLTAAEREKIRAAKLFARMLSAQSITKKLKTNYTTPS